MDFTLTLSKENAAALLSMFEQYKSFNYRSENYDDLQKNIEEQIDRHYHPIICGVKLEPGKVYKASLANSWDDEITSWYFKFILECEGNIYTDWAFSLDETEENVDYIANPDKLTHKKWVRSVEDASADIKACEYVIEKFAPTHSEKLVKFDWNGIKNKVEHK